MRILLAKTAGFCFGVDRAINILYDNIKMNHVKIYTLGPIIHNQQVVNDLDAKGVQAIKSIEEAEEEDAKIIIRTHGIGKKTYLDMKENNKQYIDATCPYVQKIHRIVERHYKDGYQILIVGDEQHPEVQGINGWCDNQAIIINNIEELHNKFKYTDKTCVVAQTTFNNELWEEIIKHIKDLCPEVLIFNTICNATNLRQAEAKEIAEQADIMIVIGGKHSSNTQKLYDICKQYCLNTYHIETFEELPVDIDFHNKTVGITAGASTPAWIIKEVINKMTERENVKANNNEENFAELFEQSEETFVTLNTGRTIKGTVIGVTPTEVYVDLGYKSDGIITASEFTDDPDADLKELVKVGDEIEVFVIRVNDGEGNVQLSKKKLDIVKGLEAVKNAFENKTIVSGKIIEVVKGGVIALVESIKVFIPASLVSDRFVQDLNTFIGQQVSMRIIDFNERKRRVVGSVREVLEEEKERKAKEVWEKLEVGKRLNGTVKQLTNFGAFVDLGGVDGLIHISELSWTKIKHPSQILNEGDIVEVYVIDFDKEQNRISLGFKKAEDNPWMIAKSKFNIGDVVKCKVVRLVPFGAFVELMEGVDGLIHISQISNRHIAKPEDVLTVGQELEAKIMEMDLDNQKISLSIRELLGKEEKLEVKEDAEQDSDDNKTPNEYTEEVTVTIGDVVNEQSADSETEK